LLDELRRLIRPRHLVLCGAHADVLDRLRGRRNRSDRPDRIGRRRIDDENLVGLPLPRVLLELLAELGIRAAHPYVPERHALAVQQIHIARDPNVVGELAVAISPEPGGANSPDWANAAAGSASITISATRTAYSGPRI
jgi:hypothetical protein